MTCARCRISSLRGCDWLLQEKVAANVIFHGDTSYQGVALQLSRKENLVNELERYFSLEVCQISMLVTQGLRKRGEGAGNANVSASDSSRISTIGAAVSYIRQHYK